MEVITVLQGQRLDSLNQGDEEYSAQRFAFALLWRMGGTLLCFELFVLEDQKTA